MKKKKKENGSSFEEGMLKLLRTLPKVLKFLPSDKAKDARNFMMSFQYWLGGKGPHQRKYSSVIETWTSPFFMPEINIFHFQGRLRILRVCCSCSRKSSL